MQISRRAFLQYLGTAAAGLGLARTELAALAAALRNPAGPNVVWLEGLACSGCSVSFLNHLSATPPRDVADVLIDVVNLRYHTTVMAAAGETAVDSAYEAYQSGNFILVVEGAVPTAFGGRACYAWHDHGREVTLLEAVQTFGAAAARVVCVGQCAAYGGICSAAPNPTGAQSVSSVLGRSTINVAGCPPHPQWTTWVLAQLVAGNSVPVDAYGRPTQFFSTRVHNRCPLRNAGDATAWGNETLCKENLGCQGRSTYGNCPDLWFNGGVNWCIGVGAQCLGCTSPAFPGTGPLYRWSS